MKYDYPVDVGRKFGHLTVVETGLKQELKKNPGHFQTVAKCVCDCGSGKEVLVTPALLRNGLVSSCGCLRAPKTKIGDRSGDLEVIKCGYTKGRKGNMRQMVLCKCHRCGGEIELLETVFTHGKRQTCGCFRRVEIAPGTRKGHLVVIGEEGKDKNFNRLLRCKCDCGKEIVLTLARWNRKTTTSCGCDRVEKGRVDSKGEFHVYGPIANGTRFGHLVVLDGSIVKGAARYAKCRCDCGKEVEVPQSELRHGKHKSCGCYGSVPVGSVFGRLTVIDNTVKGHNRKGEYSMAKCVCSCPAHTVVVVSQNELKRGTTRSCGCLARERVTKHGLSRDPLYFKLKGMINRCTDPNGKYAAHYCLKGIKVAHEWREDPAAFIKWALEHGYEYGKKLTIDRIDNDGDYCPENCRIVTQAEQNRNKSDTVFIDFNGERLCISEWARRIGITDTSLGRRLKAGWTVEEALTAPAGRTRGWRKRMTA